MNNIVYAGRIPFGDRPAAGGLISNKSLKIYVPDADGQGGCVNCTGGSHGFGRGEIVIIPPNVPHKIADNYGGITVLIEQPLLPLNEVEVTADVENDGIRRAAEQAVAFSDDDRDGKEGVLSALGALITAYIAAYRPREKSSPVVVALRDDIEKNIGDSAYSVDVAIRKLPLNYDYVRKLFKKEIGVTPHEYLTRMRMQRAKAIMLSGVTNRYSDYSVTQIAEACGFTEPLYFSRVFKKYYGVAPSQYQKNL